YVFISAMAVQRVSAQHVIDLALKAGKKIVARGPLFTTEPAQFDHVHHLVLNEAEITLPQFLTDVAHTEPRHIYQTGEFPDIEHTPVPRWDLLNLKAYDSLSIQFSRGCPFNCDFCNITSLLGH